MAGGHPVGSSGKGSDGVAHYTIEESEDNITAPLNGFQLANQLSERFTVDFDETVTPPPLTFKWRENPDFPSADTYTREVFDVGLMRTTAGHPTTPNNSECNTKMEITTSATLPLSTWDIVFDTRVAIDPLSHKGGSLRRLYVTDGTYAAWLGVADNPDGSRNGVYSYSDAGGSPGNTTFPWGISGAKHKDVRIRLYQGPSSLQLQFLVKDRGDPSWTTLLNTGVAGWGTDAEFHLLHSRGFAAGEDFVNWQDFSVTGTPDPSGNFARTTGDIVTPTITLPVGRLISSVYLEHEDLDSNNYIASVQIRNAANTLVLATANSTITSGATTILTDSDFTPALSSVGEDFRIRTGLVGEGDKIGPRVTLSPFATLSDLPAEPIVGITRPFDEATYSRASNIEIGWYLLDDVTPLADIDVLLEYSLNNGTTWNTIDTVAGDTSSYLWGSPDINTSTGIIRLTATDLDTNTGTDEVSFNLVEPDHTGPGEPPPVDVDPEIVCDDPCVDGVPADCLQIITCRPCVSCITWPPPPPPPSVTIDSLVCGVDIQCITPLPTFPDRSHGGNAELKPPVDVTPLVCGFDVDCIGTYPTFPEKRHGAVSTGKRIAINPGRDVPTIARLLPYENKYAMGSLG